VKGAIVKSAASYIYDGDGDRNRCLSILHDHRAGDISEVLAWLG